MFTPVTEEFFDASTLELSRSLLGQILVHELPEGIVAGRIVETEAYMGAEDRAAHSFGNRRTKRTEIMFGKPGLVYTYQMHTHTLINVVAEAEDTPRAILIRAVEPVEGIDLMGELRGKHMPMKQWTSGPGKLTKAMAITMDYYGHHFTEKPLYIARGNPVQDVSVGPRVGIGDSLEAVHYPYRFWETENPFVSKFR
ncbi:DNA-3-methyladenine glycosylase [Planococcus halocryophilus]|uniref:DNA-3-methyladenine glycosylase n=1 Tax=Planococcus halocryophilus TaxID=1215089 RepID=UPI001F117E7E|nr:DNA-3-methyladenine glycosylase [Planococcus halocryophilus]MCH4826553.1 DNA-3-methyladenine glycosylase [Planococcus halocryophilus]